MLKNIWFAMILLLLWGLPSFSQARSLPAYAQAGMIATQHALATGAGLQVLKNGGNAVDAAVTAAFTLSVVEPYNSGLGGGGFLLAYDAKPKKEQSENIWFLDYRERAPLKSHKTMYLSQGKPVPGLSVRGWLAPGVPGTVKGLVRALEKGGTISLKEAMKPAIHYAKKGFKVDPVLHRRLKRRANDMHLDPEAKRIFYKPDGRPWEIGDQLIQKELAKTLTLIARKGSRVFYEGKIAQKIVLAHERNNGLISLADLKAYQTYMLAPVRGNYAGYEIVSAPPPSSGGGVIIQSLNILSGVNLSGYGFGAAKSIHLVAEAMRASFRDRARYYGDPRFHHVPLKRLLSPEYAQRRRKEIIKKKKADTTHLVVVDAWGNAVSLTQTLNTSFGAAVVVPGTGIVLNNEMDDFSIAPGVPNTYGLVGNEANSIAPGKTPLSSMSPTMVLKDGKPYLVLGSPGGPRIITSVLNTILNVVDFQMNIRDAVQAPRFHHQYLPNTLFMEQPGFSPDSLRQLKRLGHRIKMQDHWSNVQAIMIEANENSRQLSGASDDRGVGLVAGY